MPPNPNSKSWSACFESVLYHAEYYLLFEGFIKEELDRRRSVACSSLLWLEEMYSDHGFMKKLGAHLSFLKVKSPTIKIYMDFFQQKVPHITEAHNKMESLLYYLEKNTHLIVWRSYFLFWEKHIHLWGEEGTCSSREFSLQFCTRETTEVCGGRCPASPEISQADPLSRSKKSCFCRLYLWCKW